MKQIHGGSTVASTCTTLDKLCSTMAPRSPIVLIDDQEDEEEDQEPSFEQELKLAQCLPALEHRVMMSKDILEGALTKAKELDEIPFDRDCIQKLKKAQTILEEALDSIKTQLFQSAETVDTAVGFVDFLFQNSQHPAERRVRRRMHHSDSPPSACS